jgi:hypothetical protein
MTWRCRLDCKLVIFPPVVFAPDNRRMGIGPEDDRRDDLLTFVDVETGQRLPDAPNPNVLFTTDRNVSQVDVLDPLTGRARYALAFSKSCQVQAELSADRKTLLITEMPRPVDPPWWRDWFDNLMPKRLTGTSDSSMTVHVYDLETGEALGKVHADYSPNVEITSDRQSVLTYRDLYEGGQGQPVRTVIECWDLPPARPLGKAIGIPLALGVSVIAVGYGWRRWRHRRAPAPQEGAWPCA